jgi:hypothetical protein
MKRNPNNNTEVAGSFYHPSDYKRNNTVSSGIATSHEQAMDAYKEGEIGAVIDDVDGKDIPIPRKGYDKE